MANNTFPCPTRLWGSFFCFAAAAALLAGCGREDSPVPPPALAEEWHQGADFSGENALRHAAALCELGPRPSGSPSYDAQLGYLETRLTAAGWMVHRTCFHAPNGTAMTNLHAVFGENTDTRPVLISCHIDTKAMPGFIGADDGASAAAVMLELARVLEQSPELAGAVELLFLDGEEAFGAHMNEEDGLYGSKHDVAQRLSRAALPRYQINLDMVGGADNVIAVPAYDTSDTMLAQYAKALMAENLPTSRWSVAAASYRDDHRPYQEAGVDSLNLIADFRGSSWWHRKGDTFERLSARMMNQAGRLTLRLVSQLLQP